MGVTRLNWFWQAVVAVFGGCHAFAALVAFTSLLTGVTALTGVTDYPPNTTVAIFYICVVIVLPSMFLTAMVAVIRTRREFDSETRCRKCGQVLRAITEPRCPECGERI